MKDFERWFKQYMGYPADCDISNSRKDFKYMELISAWEASKANAQQRCDEIADRLDGCADASENGEILQHKLLRDLARELRNNDKESE